jgi:hypothetical protein
MGKFPKVPQTLTEKWVAKMSEKKPASWRYYGVETPLDTGGRIYINADTFEIKDGCLVFTSEAMSGPSIAFAPGQWTAVFLASGLGGPPAVEYWGPVEPPPFEKNGDARITALARRVARKVRERGGIKKREIINSVLRSDERTFLPAIIETAETHGWLVPDGERAWRPGPSRPIGF